MKLIAALAVVVALMGWSGESAPEVKVASLSTGQFVESWDQRARSARRDLVRAHAVYTERSDVVRRLRERIEAVQRQREIARTLVAPGIG